MIDMKISKASFLSALVLIKICGVAFATLLFARFSPLIDSELYLKGFYSAEPMIRTRLISDVASFLNNLGGPYFAHIFFALFSTAGLIYYCFTCNRRWLVLPFLVLPSSFVWTSVVGKDAIYFGALGMALVIWSKYALGKLNVLDVSLLLLAVGICLALRPHYSMALVWLFFSVLVLRKLGHRARPALVMFLTSGAVIGYLTVWKSLLLRGFGGIDPGARASRFTEFAINQNSFEGFINYEKLVPLGFIYGMIGPVPSEVINRIEFLPFFIEGVFILFFPLVLLAIVKKMDFRSKPEFLNLFWWCLVPAMIMLMVIHAPFGFLNPGSATRWRTDFDQVFYFAPLLLLFRLIDYEEKANSPFPH
jgi:hypothetical protein